MVLLFVTLITLKAIRCHVFFALAILALCYCDFYKIFNKKLPLKIDKIKEYLLFALILISAISHIYSFKFTNIVKETQYPVYALEFIKENKIKGNLLLNFHNGSYAAYKLYPDNFVFMDGRYEEVYENNLIDKMGLAFRAIKHKEFLNEFHHDIIIIEKYYQLFFVLREDKEWFLAYEDENYGLFLRKKYKNHKFKQPTKDKSYYSKTKFETNIDWMY